MIASRGFRTPKLDLAILARKVVGLIWIAGALWNAGWSLRQDNPWSWLEDSPVPVYEWFFAEVVSRNPAFWTVLVIIAELSLGVLTFSRGRASRLGLLGGALFSAFLFSLGSPYTLMMGVYAVVLAIMTVRLAADAPAAS